jgi:aminoglycoside 3-N-acetyltransferase
MSEEETIHNQTRLNTVESIALDLQQLGINPGTVLLVHSSLSKLGWVCGGAVAVVQALMQIITPSGTLVMPTHSGDLSEPGRWHLPPVPQDWWQPIRDTMPAFHPAYTPTRGMGKIPEVFRTMPGVIRSDHPAVSFAAWGKDAEFITSNHSLAFSLGGQSPLARIYDLNGSVLLLGVGFGNHTSFHLSEFRAKNRKYYQEGSPVNREGCRSWVVYEELDWNDEPFEQIGADFEKTGQVIKSTVGNAEAKFFSQRDSVDFAVRWLDAHQPASNENLDANN